MRIARLQLRTALLTIAIIGIVMGIPAAFQRRLATREAAIRAVDRKHGTYGVKITGPDWLRSVVLRLGGDERMFYDPNRVSFGPMNSGFDHGHPFEDTDLTELSGHLALFSNLEILDLRSNRRSTDLGIASLPEFPKLKQIRLEGTRVSDEGVATLRRRFSGCEVVR